MAPENDRDPVMDPLLSRALSGLRPVDLTCVDAETMAAWVEQKLTPGVAAQVEAHLSSCPRCQAVMATFVRSAPEPAPVQSLWKRWQIGWLVPVAGTAMAIAIYVAARPPAQPAQPNLDSLQSRVEIAEEPRSAAPEAPAPTAPVASPAAAADATPEARTDAPSVSTQAAKAQENVARDVAAPREERQVQGFEPPTQTPAQPNQSTRVEADARSSQPAADSPPAAPPQAAAGVAARALAAAAPLEVRSVVATERWRVGGAGSVEHSVDAGATFQPVATPVSAGIRAGSSPAAGICWLAGSGGAVWLSTDGIRFRRLPFPEAVDLGSVVASSAVAATVTSADGRTFRTNNQGVTWSQ